MVIGDKVKLVNHSFYNGRYGRIIDFDINTSQYKVCVDIDKNCIWVHMENVEPASVEKNITGCFDEHYRKMKVQPILLAQDVLTPEEMIGAMKFNIIKYSLRAGCKDGEPVEKDLAKKDRYENWLKLLLKGKRIDV